MNERTVFIFMLICPSENIEYVKYNRTLYLDKFSIISSLIQSIE
jgi:hypothetical protein